MWYFYIFVFWRIGLDKVQAALHQRYVGLSPCYRVQLFCILLENLNWHPLQVNITNIWFFFCSFSFLCLLHFEPSSWWFQIIFWKGLGSIAIAKKLNLQSSQLKFKFELWHSTCLYNNTTHIYRAILNRMRIDAFWIFQ